jgi:hypothetical protein
METFEALKATVILILTLIVTYYSTQLTPRRKRMSKDEKFKKDMKALGAIIIGSIAFFLIAKYFADSSFESDTKEKTAHFQRGKELMCGVGRFSKSNEGYLVSKANGWSLKGDEHFLKGDILIK